jgi:hypothetical protein
MTLLTFVITMISLICSLVGAGLVMSCFLLVYWMMTNDS